jgi:hypothetical protein
MRQKWVKACQRRSLDDFVAYPAYRSEVHAETVAVTDAVKRVKLARADLATTRGVRGVLYFVLENCALAVELGDNLPLSDNNW